MPQVSWCAIVVALGVLALLGGALGKAVHGSPFAWSAALLAGGVLLAYIGSRLEII
ncbi:hypothetical protein [Methylomicrobium agile]|uniref:hypothetical protein n=1 Tax=Methylomicrobium agile TaxID=39774 RepID=UPI000A54B5D0|nr:hypothetical protein [Methylomicrobium agile]